MVAGVAGFEPTRAVLETARLPLSYTPMVGHSGIEPETSDLSGLRANLLRQCPMKLPLCQSYIRNGPQGDRLHTYVYKTHVISHSALY